MPQQGWRRAWELHYRPIEVVAALCLLIFTAQRVSLYDPSWWNVARYGWIGENTLFSQVFTLVAAIAGLYGIIPRPRQMGRHRLLFHDAMRSVGAGVIIILNGLTTIRSFDAHSAAPVATWGLVFGLILVWDIWSE